MIFAKPAAKTLEAVHGGLVRFIDEINRFHQPVNRWPTFADDAAAEAGNLKIGAPYATPTGELRRRAA